MMQLAPHAKWFLLVFMAAMCALCIAARAEDGEREMQDQNRGPSERPGGLAGDERRLRINDTAEIELVYVQPGSFQMGRARWPGGLQRLGVLAPRTGVDEGPPRQVTITKGFYFGKYKITCEESCAFLNAVENPDAYVNLNKFSQIEKRDGAYVPKEGCARCAVNVVHWRGAREFCNWLARQTGQKVRLPTEAEWEFACRGREGRERPWGEKEDVQWRAHHLDPRQYPVDAYPENVTPEGVVGMIDFSVGEWCSDYYGIKYLREDTIDPQGPAKEQLSIESDWPEHLAPVKGEYWVLRGRYEPGCACCTNRSFAAVVPDDSGVYELRVVVEASAFAERAD